MKKEVVTCVKDVDHQKADTMNEPLLLSTLKLAWTHMVMDGEVGGYCLCWKDVDFFFFFKKKKRQMK